MPCLVLWFPFIFRPSTHYPTCPLFPPPPSSYLSLPYPFRRRASKRSKHIRPPRYSPLHRLFRSSSITVLFHVAWQAMARTSQLQQIGHPCRTKLESDHLQADEDHFAVLSPTSLDGQISEMSSATDQLRDSFVENSTMFPPSTVAWPSYPYGHESLPAAPVFTEHRSNAYSAHDAPPNNSPFASQAIWPSSGPSGSCTPTLGYEGFVASYETGRAVPYGSADTHTVDPTITFDHRPVHSAPAFPPAGPCSTSPPSIKDWMSPASSDQHAEFSCIAAQLHSRSPSFLGATQLLRRDGIRKKNARFEIPAERNLRTIDHMINQTNDEHEIKELKQQKRLLRNRQAA